MHECTYPQTSALESSERNLLLERVAHTTIILLALWPQDLPLLIRQDLCVCGCVCFKKPLNSGLALWAVGRAEEKWESRFLVVCMDQFQDRRKEVA